jgi:hypothetical protein
MPPRRKPATNNLARWAVAIGVTAKTTGEPSSPVNEQKAQRAFSKSGCSSCLGTDYDGTDRSGRTRYFDSSDHAITPGWSNRETIHKRGSGRSVVMSANGTSGSEWTKNVRQ